MLTVGIYDQTFFSASNFLSVTADTMTLFLMASGVTLVIMMGGIDLSVQAVASMASCILAAYLPRFGFLAIPLAVLGGCRCRICRRLCLDPAAHSLLHRHTCGERRGAQCRLLVFRERSVNIPGDLSASLSRLGDGRSSSACPMKSGWAWSSWSC